MDSLPFAFGAAHQWAIQYTLCIVSQNFSAQMQMNFDRRGGARSGRNGRTCHFMPVREHV